MSKTVEMEVVLNDDGERETSLDPCTLFVDKTDPDQRHIIFHNRGSDDIVIGIATVPNRAIFTAPRSLISRIVIEPGESFDIRVRAHIGLEIGERYLVPYSLDPPSNCDGADHGGLDIGC